MKTFSLIFTGFLKLTHCQNRFLSECVSAQEMEKSTKLISKNVLVENYHQRDRRDVARCWVLVQRGKALY